MITLIGAVVGFFISAYDWVVYEFPQSEIADRYGWVPVAGMTLILVIASWFPPPTEQEVTQRLAAQTRADYAELLRRADRLADDRASKFVTLDDIQTISALRTRCQQQFATLNLRGADTGAIQALAERDAGGAVPPLPSALPPRKARGFDAYLPAQPTEYHGRDAGHAD